MEDKVFPEEDEEALEIEEEEEEEKYARDLTDVGTEVFALFG